MFLFNLTNYTWDWDKFFVQFERMYTLCFIVNSISSFGSFYYLCCSFVDAKYVVFQFHSLLGALFILSLYFIICYCLTQCWFLAKERS